MNEPRTSRPTTLAQRLAVMTQVHLPGTVGRILKQNRDIEAIAPYFKRAGLVRSYPIPVPFTLKVAGIVTNVATRPVWGGLLYASAAVRVDLTIENSAIKTTGEDSACEIDDIDYEDQSKRFQLIGIRQAYEMAAAAIRSGDRPDLILMDCPLVLNRSMVPMGDPADSPGYRRAYEEAIEGITRFWNEHQAALFPWNPQGVIVASLASERFGAIIFAAQQDLRTVEGRKHLLATEEVDDQQVQNLVESQTAIASVGARRFLQGILEKQTRTVAFRMNVKAPRMEPAVVAANGVIGLHVRAVDQNAPQLVQIIGDGPGWTRTRLDRLAGEISALTISSGKHSIPIPLLLASQATASVPSFVDAYRSDVEDHIRRRQLETDWLSGIEEFHPENE
ncbi:MAG: hypothetical protein JST28_10005 [Acidobacteria bacterium]|nr:hypothetical protein [Acidobacteriota bacterium]